MNTIPFSEEFEKALIVGILSDPSLLPKVTLTLEPADFYRDSHREIYETIISLDIENIDSLAVENNLTDATVKDYFKGLVRDSDSMLPGLSNILYYAETIKSKAKLRAGIELGREIAAICYEDNVDSSDALIKLEQRFSSFLRTRVTDATYESTKQAFDEFVESLGIRIHDDSGTKTGFKQIDLILHKLEGMVILAGRPGLGKTAFAVNVARNVGKDKPVIFFSLEQPREQIFERILAAESDVPLEDIRTGAFIGNQQHVEQIAEAKESLSDLFENVHVDDTSAVSSAYISSVARQKYFEQGEIGLIVVDYLHIMKLGERNLVEALGDAVKDLRALGRELGCPVLLLSQLSRQPETSANSSEDGKKTRRRPELSDLRSSGEIEQSADVVMFLHRESYYTDYVPDVDPVEVIIKKNRNGRIGVTELSWLPKVMRYEDRNTFASVEDDFLPWQ
jgi:replicative DNA helicase